MLLFLFFFLVFLCLTFNDYFPSAALVIAYLMETYGLTYTHAYSYVQKKRFCVNPNEGFVRQLIEYEPIYIAKHQFNMSNHHFASNNQTKRSYEEGSEEERLIVYDVEMSKKSKFL